MVATLPFFMQHGVLCMLCYDILNSKCCLVYSVSGITVNAEIVWNL